MPDITDAPPSARVLPTLTEVVFPLADGTAAVVANATTSEPQRQPPPVGAPGEATQAEIAQTERRLVDAEKVFAAIEARMVEVLALELARLEARLRAELEALRAAGWAAPAATPTHVDAVSLNRDDNG